MTLRHDEAGRVFMELLDRDPELVEYYNKNLREVEEAGERHGQVGIIDPAKWGFSFSGGKEIDR